MYVIGSTLNIIEKREKPWIVGQALEFGVCEHLQVIKLSVPFD